MSEIQKLPEWSGEGGRPETGPMQFGNDWPGVFIRGDNALVFAIVCRHALAKLGDDGDGASRLTRAQLEGLASTLASCRV